MLFSRFAQYLAKLETLSSRLDKTAVLAELFQNLNQQEIVVASYLLQGSLVPSYQSLEFQLSSKMLLKALAVLVANGNGDELKLAQKQLNRRYKQTGDLGTVVEQVVDSLTANKHTLNIEQVYQALVAIAQESGTGSQDRKIKQLNQLLEKITSQSAKYIARIILGKMRLGFSTMTMLDALSWAKVGDKSQAADLERAFSKKADFGLLAQSYLAEAQLVAQDFLVNYHMALGIPVVPTLCQRLNSAQEIIDKMGQVIAEPKYDGLRMQIHVNKRGFTDGKIVKAFTRNLEEVSYMFPELSELVEHVQVATAVFDSEAVGIHPQTGQFFAFQETISRKRKYQIQDQADQVPICFFIFDCLYAADQALIDQPLTERKAKLAQILTASTVAQVTPYQLISDPSLLRQYHHQQLAAGLEGAVMKKPNSAYVAGRKGWRWVKIKEAEGQRGKLNDTVDCIMLGYYLGKGKRQAFGIGALLVGVVDSQSGRIKTLSKIGTGLTDQQFQEIKLLANQHLATDNRPPTTYEFNKNLAADVWLEPAIVLEVAADEISKSPSHTAGVALRFPRLIKIRQDKTWQDATTLQELAAINIA